VYGGKSAIYEDTITDYKLPLEQNIAPTLRQSLAQSGMEELFLKMKREGKFDEENPVIKFDKIIRTKTVIRLPRGAAAEYDALF